MCCCTSALARDGGAQWLHVDYEEDLEPFFRGRGFRPTPAGLFYLAGDPATAGPAYRREGA